MTSAPAQLYVGHRETILTECSPSLAFYPGKYLIYPNGNGNWDAIGCNSKAELKIALAELQAAYPNAQIVRV